MASRQQYTSGVSVPASQERARSESISTSGGLTPTSSQDDTPLSPAGQAGIISPDSALPSIEHGIETLEINVRNTTVSTPPVPHTSVTSINERLGQLQLEEGTSATPDRGSSLSPEMQHRTTSRPRSSRRSSSRNPVQRYEVDHERPTGSRFYENDFQESLSQSRDLARQLTNALSSCHLHNDEDSVIHSLYNQAKEASIYCGPQKWKIGLVGDSGVGKSSLINSLLDVQGLARASNSGAACTCTVTEYHYHDASEYTIEVTYFTKQRLEHQLTELLRAYRRFHSNQAEDSAERQELEEASSVAWNTFKSAFRNQSSLTEAYLMEQDEPTLLGNISSWIDQSAPQHFNRAAGQPNTRRESLPDHRACSQLLMELTSEPADMTAVASWPYIESVKVFSQAVILSRGLILVDLPGLRDTNSARRLITENYIVNCNEVFAIANIGRATTDEGVKAVIDLARRTKRQHVGIVCTKSDDIQANEAVRGWTGESQRLLRLYKRRLDACQEELRTITDALSDDLDVDEELDLHRERRSIEENLHEHNYRLQQHMVETRNSDVSNELRRIYQPTVENVFCVSNTFYWDHRNEACAASLPWLQLSGIISLRLHCLGLVAEQQLRHASAFMRDEIPSLVSSIDLWVQSGSGRIAAETRARVREASTQVERILQREIGSVTSQLNGVLAVLDGYLGDSVRSRHTNETNQAWRTIAKYAALEWSGWHWGNYAAFCRNQGTHTTGAVGSRCWNREIIQGMLTDLDIPWQQFYNFTRDFFSRRSGTVDRVFQQALDPLQTIDLSGNNRENFDSVQTLVTTILQRKTLLQTETLHSTTEYERALSLLGNAYFLSDTRTSFIGQYMEPSYQRATQDSGTGSFARRRGVINSAVTNPGLFYDLFHNMQTHFLTLTREAEEKVQEVNRRHFQAVRTALDTLRNENVLMEAERNPDFRERLRREVLDAQRIVEQIVGVVRTAG